MSLTRTALQSQRLALRRELRAIADVWARAVTEGLAIQHDIHATLLARYDALAVLDLMLCSYEPQREER